MSNSSFQFRSGSLLASTRGPRRRVTIRESVVPLAFVAMLGCATPPPEAVYVELYKVGLFGVRGVEVSDPNSPFGSHREANRRRFFLETHEVPAKLGTNFGIGFRVTSDPPRPTVDLEVLWITPPITSPDTGETFSEFGHSETLVSNRKQHLGFGFDRQWECVAGTWKLQLIHANEVVFETTFEVLSP